MKTSSFTSDLEKEKRLASFLNILYNHHLLHYSFVRESDLTQQYKGVDLVLIHKKTKKVHLVDEKAQLDYINEDLPTFAFELSYEKNGARRLGWLFDPNKKTQFYALVTGIYSDEPNLFTSAKITFVNRQMLIAYLRKKGVVNGQIQLPENHGRYAIPPLNQKHDGYLFFSKRNKIEQPLNLVLRLDFLIYIGVAKRLV